MYLMNFLITTSQEISTIHVLYLLHNFRLCEKQSQERECHYRIMHADDDFNFGSFLSIHYTHADNTDRYTVINSFCIGAYIYEHIVIQNKNHTDLLYLKVVIKKCEDY